MHIISFTLSSSMFGACAETCPLPISTSTGNAARAPAQPGGPFSIHWKPMPVAQLLKSTDICVELQIGETSGCVEIVLNFFPLCSFALTRAVPLSAHLSLCVCSTAWRSTERWRGVVAQPDSGLHAFATCFTARAPRQPGRPVSSHYEPHRVSSSKTRLSIHRRTVLYGYTKIIHFRSL